jgi:hypothetical protein
MKELYDLNKLYLTLLHHELDGIEVSFAEKAPG